MEYWKLEYESVKPPEPKTITGTCEECGKEFEAPVTGRKRKYCSDACRKRAHRTRGEFKRVFEDAGHEIET